MTLFMSNVLAFNGLHLRQLVCTFKMFNYSVHQVCWNSLSQVSKEKRTSSPQSI